VGIPTHLKALRQLAKKEGWQDAPQALSSLRNELAHLRPEAGQRPPKAWIDAWRLSVWYCEVVILAWLGYGGHYLNRLRGPVPLGGPTEPLPVLP